MDVQALPLLFELVARCFNDECDADDPLRMVAPLLHFFYSTLTKKISEEYSGKSGRCFQVPLLVFELIAKCFNEECDDDSDLMMTATPFLQHNEAEENL